MRDHPRAVRPCQQRLTRKVVLGGTDAVHLTTRQSIRSALPRTHAALMWHGIAPQVGQQAAERAGPGLLDAERRALWTCFVVTGGSTCSDASRATSAAASVG
jgi:hypothetical protein